MTQAHTPVAVESTVPAREVRWFRRSALRLMGVWVFVAIGLAVAIAAFVTGQLVGGLLFLGMSAVFVWSVLINGRVGVTSTGLRFGGRTIELADVQSLSFRAIALRRLGIAISRSTVLAVRSRQGTERALALFRPAKPWWSPDDYAALLAVLRTRPDIASTADQLEQLLAVGEAERLAFFRSLSRG